MRHGRFDVMDSVSIAFWGILGGMSLICVLTVAVIYFMCFSRNRCSCTNAVLHGLQYDTEALEQIKTTLASSSREVALQAVQLVSSENEDLLETTVHHEEVHTITSETRTDVSGSEEPKVVHRTEQIRRVTTKQRSRGNLLQAQTSQPVTSIRVSPKSDQSETRPSSSGSNDSAFNETSFEETLTRPRLGQPQLTSIGTSS